MHRQPCVGFDIRGPRAVYFIRYESAIRLGCFAVVLALMALWQLAAPRRQLATHQPVRWFSNLGLAAVNTLVLRILLPAGALSIALLAEERGWGLFNNISVPASLAVLLSVVALDFVIYLQHVVFHAVPI